MKESFVCLFPTMGKPRKDGGGHRKGRVQSGIVKGTDSCVHAGLHGGGGGKGPICSGPYLGQQSGGTVDGVSLQDSGMKIGLCMILSSQFLSHVWPWGWKRCLGAFIQPPPSSGPSGHRLQIQQQFAQHRSATHHMIDILFPATRIDSIFCSYIANDVLVICFYAALKQSADGGSCTLVRC